VFFGQFRERFHIATRRLSRFPTELNHLVRISQKVDFHFPLARTLGVKMWWCMVVGPKPQLQSRDSESSNDRHVHPTEESDIWQESIIENVRFCYCWAKRMLRFPLPAMTIHDWPAFGRWNQASDQPRVLLFPIAHDDALV